VASLTDTVKAGALPKDMSHDELLSVQAHALHTVQATFADAHGGDAALLKAVGNKIPSYAASGKDTVLTKRPVVRQQTDALKVLIHTFKGTDEGDVALRAAAFEKLGAMGTKEDALSILPLVRKPPHSADLYGGLEASRAILARDGSPIPRGDAHVSSEAKQLLTKPQLTDAERTTVIKEVLSHGEIVGVTKNMSPTMNAVYFLKFKETVPGPDGKRIPIEAVWKAEGTFQGKEKANFVREVAAFEFENRFAKTDIVPVTVEGVLSPDQLPGDAKPFGIGSLQYKVPGGESIGQGYPNSKLLKPKYEAFLHTPEGQKQIDEIRAHLYVMNDPEKLPNSGGYNVANFGNILAVPDSSKPGGIKLLLIDNGTALGAQSQFGTAIRKDMLPNHPTQTSSQLSHASSNDIKNLLAPLIGDGDAADVANRTRDATQ
jgi:hypothetical protein